MKTYRVSRILNQRELAQFLDDNPNVIFSIEGMPEEQAAAPQQTAVNFKHQDTNAIYTPERGPRRKRTSKVNDAILGSLEKGMGEISDLKTALEDAGMSAASLSTGLAILQKAGTVKRSEGGFYFLAEKEAAE